MAEGVFLLGGRRLVVGRMEKCISHVEERMTADLVDDNADGQWAPKFDADGSRRPMSMGAETGG